MKYSVLVKEKEFAVCDTADKAIQMAQSASIVFPKSVCSTIVDGECYTFILGSRVYL